MRQNVLCVRWELMSETECVVCKVGAVRQNVLCVMWELMSETERVVCKVGGNE